LESEKEFVDVYEALSIVLLFRNEELESST
jgi:hypothetical protein